LAESQATVGRRMQRLEAHLGVMLLKRGVNSVTILPAGYDLLQAVSPMSEAVEEIPTALAPHRRDAHAPLKVTTTNTMALFLTAHIKDLAAAIAPRTFVLLPTRRIMDIANGEADIALRMRSPPPNSEMLSRRLGNVMFAVYGIKEHAALPMIMPSGDSSVSKQRACAELILLERPRGPQIDELHLRLQAVKIGVGVGLLPCWIGDNDPELVKVDENFSGALDDELFMVRPARSKSDRDVSALAEALARLLRKHRSVLSGKR
jgi:DNA-binding transcriptional LysR family regulator